MTFVNHRKSLIQMHFVRNIFLLSFLGLSLSVQAQLSRLEKLKGTWLITRADTSNNDVISQDSIITKLYWSKDDRSLEGKQKIKINGRITFNEIRYNFNGNTGGFSYSENSGPDSPLVIDGNVWIYPAGNFRTLNTFNDTGTEIIYEVQELVNDKWVTTRSGKEIKIEP
jgi:hypothetical protein